MRKFNLPDNGQTKYSSNGKAGAILISLLIGFVAGVVATAYLREHYGYLIEKQVEVMERNASTRNQNDQKEAQTQSESQQPSTVQPEGVAIPSHRPAQTHPHNEAKHGVDPPMIRETPSIIAQDIIELQKRQLLLPVRNLRREDLRDSFDESRGNHNHEAIDILAPRNTAILAVEDGSIARLWHSAYGGITIYQFDPEQKYEYYYAHLERYADGLKEGDHTKRGQVIGYVGTSGNAPKDTPHLHFTIFKLTKQKQWWEGTAINPYLVYRKKRE